jgi:hypothetical protein
MRLQVNCVMTQALLQHAMLTVRLQYVAIKL